MQPILLNLCLCMMTKRYEGTMKPQFQCCKNQKEVTTYFELFEFSFIFIWTYQLYTVHVVAEITKEGSFFIFYTKHRSLCEEDKNILPQTSACKWHDLRCSIGVPKSRIFGKSLEVQKHGPVPIHVLGMANFWWWKKTNWIFDPNLVTQCKRELLKISW